MTYFSADKGRFCLKITSFFFMFIELRLLWSYLEDVVFTNVYNDAEDMYNADLSQSPPQDGISEFKGYILGGIRFR